jgi:hypothetical protein
VADPGAACSSAAYDAQDVSAGEEGAGDDVGSVLEPGVAGSSMVRMGGPGLREGQRRRGLDGRGRKGRQVEEEAARILRGGG